MHTRAGAKSHTHMQAHTHTHTLGETFTYMPAQKWPARAQEHSWHSYAAPHSAGKLRESKNSSLLAPLLSSLFFSSSLSAVWGSFSWWTVKPLSWSFPPRLPCRRWHRCSLLVHPFQFPLSPPLLHDISIWHPGASFSPSCFSLSLCHLGSTSEWHPPSCERGKEMKEERTHPREKKKKHERSTFLPPYKEMHVSLTEDLKMNKCACTVLICWSCNELVTCVNQPPSPPSLAQCQIRWLNSTGTLHKMSSDGLWVDGLITVKNPACSSNLTRPAAKGLLLFSRLLSMMWMVEFLRNQAVFSV